MKIRLGTRGSRLAMWQAERVKKELIDHGHKVDIIPIRTAGDRDRSTPLWQIKTVGVFVKEIQRALLERKIDIAVHSAKDMPTDSPDTIILAAVLERDFPRDCLVKQKDKPFIEYKDPICIGTSSMRRKTQLFITKKNICFKDLRGNVETRLKKLRSSQFDMIVMSEAGIKRMEIDLSDLFVEPLSYDICVPAAGQGIVAIEALENNHELLEVLKGIDNVCSHTALRIERDILRSLEGGCRAPIAVHAERKNDGWTIWCCISTPDAKRFIKYKRSFSSNDTKYITTTVINELESQDVHSIVEETRRYIMNL